MKAKLSTLAVREQAAEVRARIAECTAIQEALLHRGNPVIRDWEAVLSVIVKRRDAWERELAELTRG